ncbi:MAG: ATP-binding protein [Ktedonobacterales bacterium]
MSQRVTRQSDLSPVERDDQLKALMDAFESVRQGAVRCVFVTAEPGAGKTSIIQEFLSRVALDYPGAEAISSAGQESEQEAEAYRVLLDLLEDLTNRRGTGAGARSRQLFLTLLPSLASFIPVPFVSAGAQLGLTALTSVLGLKDEASVKNQVTIFQAFTRRIVNLAKKAPVILIVDDAQWADAPSIGAINYMLTRADKVAVLVVVAYRSSPELAPESALFTMKVDLDRRGLAQTLQLPDFDEHQTERLVRHLLPNTFPSRFMRRLFELSGGNPLFIRLFLQLLQDKSYVTRGRDGLWRLHQNVDEGVIPDSIHDIVTQRVAMMPAQSRTMCEIASVEGTRFALGVLLALAESEEQLTQAKVLRMLSDVERRFKLISSDGMTGDLAFYRFVHGLVRDTLYMSLNQPLRQYYHKRIAESLELAGKHSGGSLAFDIASHFQSGQEPLRALPYWIQAARAQRATYAVTEAALSFGSAAECADTALRALPDRDPRVMEIERQKAEALSGQAEAYGVKAFTVQAFQSATEAAALWHLLGEQREEALVVHRAALCHHEHQNYGRAVELFEQGLAIARAIDDPRLVALYLRDLGNTQAAMGEYAQALTTLTESARMFDAAGDKQEWLVTMLCLGNCQFQRGAVAESVQAYTVALDLAESYQDEYRTSQILQRQGLALVVNGQSEAGSAAAQRAAALSEKLQIEEYRAHRLLGETLFAADYYAKARAALAQAVADAVEVHPRVQQELMSYLGSCVERLYVVDRVAAQDWCERFRDATSVEELPASYALAWEQARELCATATSPTISLHELFA